MSVDPELIAARLRSYAAANGSRPANLTPAEEQAIVNAAGAALSHWWHGGPSAIAIAEFKNGLLEVILFVTAKLWSRWEKQCVAVTLAIDRARPPGRSFVVRAEQI